MPFKDSASLIITRKGRQILMGRRSETTRVLPGFYVFPGGVLDKADWKVTPSTPLNPQVQDRLARHGGERKALALAATVVRETREEVNLSLGAPDAPNFAALDYVARALTPNTMPVRFDTRFFTADASHFKGKLRGNGELSLLRFYEIEEVKMMVIAPVTRILIELLEKRLRGENPPAVTFSSRHGRFQVTPI